MAVEKVEIPPQVPLNPQHNTRVLTDFDGTLTDREGQATVEDPFYNTLFDVADVNEVNFKTSPMKAPQEIQAAFNDYYGSYTQDTPGSKPGLMSNEAVKYLHYALDNGVQVDIISKNRGEYIAAVLEYQGFSPEEISQFKVYDTNTSGVYGKGAVVNDTLQNEPGCKLFIFDDSVTDNRAMTNAAASTGNHDLTSINAPAGQFNWVENRLNLAQALGKLSNEQVIVAQEKVDAASEKYNEIKLQVDNAQNQVSKSYLFISSSGKDYEKAQQQNNAMKDVVAEVLAESDKSFKGFNRMLTGKNSVQIVEDRLNKELNSSSPGTPEHFAAKDKLEALQQVKEIYQGADKAQKVQSLLNRYAQLETKAADIKDDAINLLTINSDALADASIKLNEAQSSLEAAQQELKSARPPVTYEQLPPDLNAVSSEEVDDALSIDDLPVYYVESLQSFQPSHPMPDSICVAKTPALEMLSQASQQRSMDASSAAKEISRAYQSNDTAASMDVDYENAPLPPTPGGPGQ